MKLASFEAIIAALNRNKVRYLIVGGLAVAAHGFGRVTFDVDLVVQLQPENVQQAMRALETLGYKPVAPVSAQDFSDPSIRATWIREKKWWCLACKVRNIPIPRLTCLSWSRSISTGSLKRR